MSKIAKSFFRHVVLLLAGAVLGFALLSWDLNHSQCRGLAWNSDLKMPQFSRVESKDCMQVTASGEFEGVWMAGRELNGFYPIDSRTNEILPSKEPLILDISNATHFLIREKLELDSNIFKPQNYKIKFLGNRVTNFYGGYSPYKNHYEVQKIESISVFDGDIPRLR